MGSGPVLALIGQPMTAAPFAPLGSHFTSDHTVVTYDPRGFGRSSIDDPQQDSTPDLLADDVSRVLAAVTDEPAYVFGSSGGAVTGLALVAGHPQQVRVLVAHEPPLVDVLPDADRVRAQVRHIYDTYRAQGAGPAFGEFMAVAGFQVPEPDPAAPPPAPPSEQDLADGERMLAHALLPITGYRPDVSALSAGPTRVVIAGGAASTGQLARRAADALAEALGRPVVEFPGGHGGFLDPSAGGDPQDFARLLRQTLSSAASRVDPSFGPS